MVKAAHIWKIKAKYSIYALVSFYSKVGFFSGLKTEQNYSPQTSNHTFLVVLTAILQLKNTEVTCQAPGNAYLIVWKVGVTRTYMNEKMKSSPRGVAGSNVFVT